MGGMQPIKITLCRALEIPLGTLRDWEQTAPKRDQAKRAYLKMV
jgi:DNA-binding transcriptional regulator YiaG